MGTAGRRERGETFLKGNCRNVEANRSKGGAIAETWLSCTTTPRGGGKEGQERRDRFKAETEKLGCRVLFL